MVISLAIQVVVPLLPPPAYLAVGLSRRREASWFCGAGVLCVLGLITALIEVGVDVLG
jgi:integral membrane sensor domain MASE1